MDPDDQSRPHYAWHGLDRGTDPGPYAGLVLFALWWRWGIRTWTHTGDGPELVTVECWRPDTAPHVGQPADSCPVCADLIAQHEARIAAGLPPTGLTEPREARPSPLSP